MPDELVRRQESPNAKAATTDKGDPIERCAQNESGRLSRVWVVSELYYPEETSTGHVMTQIAEGLADAYSVSVICGQPSYAARGMSAPKVETRMGVKIFRCGSTTLDKDIFWGRLANIVTLSATVLWRACREIARADVVLVVTNPPVLPFLVNLVCRARRAVCIVVVHDVYPESLVAAGLCGDNASAVRWIDALNRWLYRTVAAIVVCGRDMRKLVLQKTGRDDDSKVVVISNWADCLSPMPRASNALLEELGLVKKFVVQYAGNLGKVHDIETLFEGMKLLAAKDSEIHLLVIGSGAKKRWLETQVAAAGLTNITILGNRSRAEQELFQNACDVSITLFVQGMKGAGVPSRMYNVMAAGKPMIAATDDDAEQALVIREEDVGWVVPIGEPARVAQAILEARSDPARLAAMGRRARLAVERRFTRLRGIQEYRLLVDRFGRGSARASESER